MQKYFFKFVYTMKHTKFKNLPIVYKLGICFFFIISFMFILSIINFIYYKNDKGSTTVSTVKQMNSQTVQEIDSNLQSMIDITKVPLFYYNSLQSYLSNSYQTRYNLANQNILKRNSDDYMKQFDPIDNMINDIFFLKENLHSVFIFDLNGGSFYKLKSASLYSPFNPTDKPWYSKTIKNFGAPVIIPTYVLSNVSEVKDNKAYVYGVSRAIIDIDDNSKMKNIVLVNGSIETLKNILSKSIIYNNQRIILINNKGYIICDTKTNEITKSLGKTDYNKLVVSPSKYSNHLKFNGTDCLITTSSSKLSDWKIINIIPISELNKNINSIKTRTYFLTFTFIFIALLLAIAVAKQIVNPIKKLSNAMKVVENGHFDIKIDVTTKDEIGTLSKTFNSMTQKIKNLIKEVYINKLAQKDMELKALQNQINPHFIYNTLESIHMMAEINNDNETAKMAINLGKIMRYGLSDSDKKVTVLDEINNLNSYIMLEEMRYDNIEKIDIDVEPSLLSAEIMKLTFQPIVENSLYHGLDTLESGGILKIIGYKVGTDMKFEILDNGLGMDTNKLDSLNGYINNLNNDFNSIGLKNVNQRIKLYYGNNYGIKIKSTVNVGTSVEILLPFKENKLKGQITEDKRQ